jgi:DNA-binding response OmpR family regulator
MLTAHDSAESIIRGFSVGTDDYVAKPFNREELIARVRRMLERTYGRDAAEQEQAPAPIAAPAATETDAGLQ